MPSSLFWPGYGDKRFERHDPPTPAAELRRELSQPSLDAAGQPCLMPFEEYLDRYAGLYGRVSLEQQR